MVVFLFKIFVVVVTVRDGFLLFDVVAITVTVDFIGVFLFKIVVAGEIVILIDGL